MNICVVCANALESNDGRVLRLPWDPLFSYERSRKLFHPLFLRVRAFRTIELVESGDGIRLRRAFDEFFQIETCITDVVI